MSALVFDVVRLSRVRRYDDAPRTVSNKIEHRRDRTCGLDDRDTGFGAVHTGVSMWTMTAILARKDGRTGGESKVGCFRQSGSRDGRTGFEVLVVLENWRKLRCWKIEFASLLDESGVSYD